MSKKERMLNLITDNVKWFLPTDTSVEVIPYYNLSSTVFSRAKECLVLGDVKYDDVVCLVSTSILKSAKSGILFTTDSMYCKSWGPLTTKCHNYYSGYDYAKFDYLNDFDENRMKELMKALNDISVDEDKNEQIEQNINEFVDKAIKIGGSILSGMAMLEGLAWLSDKVVSQKNDNIEKEIAKLENSNNQETENALTIYEDFIPLINEFVNDCENVGEEGDDISDETYHSLIVSLNNLLYELYWQTLDNVNISLEDEDDYERFGNWVEFWALMFYDKEQFKERYPIESLEEMPECWDGIIRLMDKILENAWNDSFSVIVYGFAKTIIDNSVEIHELMSNSDWDDELIESISGIIESNKQAVKTLENALGRATDYLDELLSATEE